MSLAKCLEKLNSGKPVFSQDEISEINQLVAQNLYKGMGKEAAEKVAVQSLLDDAIAERSQIIDLINEANPIAETKESIAPTVEPAPSIIDNNQAEDEAPAEPAQFSRANPSISGTELADVFSALSDHDDAARYPKSTKTDMAGIASEIDPAISVGESVMSHERYIDDEGSMAYREAKSETEVKTPDGKVVTVTENKNDKTIWINAIELEKGVSGGSAIYQLVGQYAANNGLTFIGDPVGISNAGIYRRLENMISLALKYGTTKFIEPHEDQLVATDGNRGGKKFFWPGMKWVEGDSENNLHEMLMASYTAISHHIPEIRDVFFDTDTKSFRDSRTGQEYTERDFDALADSPAARYAYAGSATLKRAALVNSVLSGKISAAAWRESLDELSQGEVGGSLAGTPVERVLYSRGAGAGMTIDELQEIVDDVSSGMKNPPPVRIVQSTGDLPFEAPNDVRGAFWDGHVYLIGDNISGRLDAIEVYAHETMGHYGLRGFFNESLDSALDFIHDVNPKVQQSYIDWKDRNQDVIKSLKKAGLTDTDIHYRAIEEAMANWAQKGETISGAKRLLFAIQKSLRAMGLGSWASRLEAKTNAEAMKMLHDAAMFVQSGEKLVDGKSAPMFSSARDRTIKKPQGAGSLEAQELKGGGVLFSKAKDGTPTLIIQHNLTEENLLHADKIGGIPVPSLAITNASHPLEGFGEITLVGGSSMADPKGYAATKVYGADIYSPRYPEITNIVKSTATDRLNKSLSKYLEMTGSGAVYPDDIRTEGKRAVENSAAVKAKFLSENGVEPAIVITKAPSLPDALDKFKTDDRDYFELAKDKEFQRAAKEAYKQEVGPVIAARIIKEEGDGFGRLVLGFARRVEQYQRESKRAGSVDSSATRYALQDQIDNNNLGRKYVDYVDQVFESLGAEEKIFQGYTDLGNRKYIPHTIDNVIKILKKEMVGGEGVNYGVGTIRSKFTPRFKSIKEIQDAKNRLLSGDSFDSVKAEIDGELENLASALAEYHEFSGSVLEGLSSALYDSAKMGLAKALNENGFRGVPKEMMGQAELFLIKLRNLPTQYFEAKILRAVDLSEFKGAVVPKDTSKKAIDALNRRGITNIKYYNNSVAGDRVAKINELAKESDLLFSKQVGMSSNAHTTDTLRASIAKAFSPKFIEKLEQTGRFVISTNESVKGIIGDVTQYSKEGRPLAFYDRDTGITHILAENIPKTFTERQIKGLLAHEIGEHALQLGKTDKEYQAIQRDLELLVKSGNKDAVAARQRAIDAGTPEADMGRETIGYLVEAAPTSSIVQRFLTLFKSMVNKVLGSARLNWAYTEKDMATMAQSALRRAPELLGGEAKGEGVLSSRNRKLKQVDINSFEFKNWFNKSKVTDSNGNPLIVYHGTGVNVGNRGEFISGDVDEFRTELSGKSSKTGAPEGTFFFTDSTDVASSYTVAWRGDFSETYKENANVMPVYLSINKPLRISAKGSNWRDIPYKGEYLDINEISQIAKETGKYDGVIVTRVKDHGVGKTSGKPSTTYIAFNPTQIKSAISNTGEFSSTTPSILLSKQEVAEKQPPAIPEETRFQKAQRKIQDKLNRFTVIKEWLADNGVKLSEAADVYKAEERMHSKFSNKAEDFREKRVAPLIQKIQKAGFSMDEVALFLHAQHAEEANKHVAKINPEKPDGGSGMMTKTAREILKNADPVLVKLSNEFRKITDDTRDLMLREGIISQEMVDAWQSAYKHYVPLKGGPDEGIIQGTGKGLKAKRTLKRRMGHGEREGGEWIIENILADYERALMLVEKNRVGKSLIHMILEAGREDIGTIGKPEKRGVIKPDQSAYVVRFNGSMVESFHNLLDAKAYVREESQKYGREKSEFQIEQVQGDPSVHYMASPMLADNEVNVYVNGHAIRVQINDDLLARAYGNMGAEALNTILQAGRALNGFLSKVYTGYNPEFIATNIVRDLSTGVINITGEQGIMFAGKSLLNYPGAFKDLLKYAVTGNETKWITDYRADGGNTGAAYLSDLERLGSDIKNEYAAYLGTMENLKKGDYAGASRAAGRTVFNSTLKWIEHLNQAGENAMRLSIYKAARESNQSRNKATSLAKNSTVNFNRKGELGQQANALYLFFNAGVQGTASLAHAHFKGEHKFQAWGLSTAMAALGYLVASSLGGGDEDEYDKLSDYTKSRNMVIKAGDGWVKIPVPYGYGFFWNTGRAMADASRKDKWGKTPWHMASSFVEEFTPFGAVVAGGKPEAKQLFYALPTSITMAGAPIMNRSGMGGPIMPEGGFDKSQPDREKMWRSTKGTMYDVLAGALDQVGMDVSPETLKHYTRSLTGGAGALVDTSISSAMLKSQGAELETKEMPFVRKFYGETSISDSRRAYYDARDEAKSALEELNRAKKARDAVRVRSVFHEKRELIALAKYADGLSKQLTAARDRQDEIRLSNMSIAEKRLALKQMEADEEKIYDRYLQVFKEKTQKH